MNEAQADKAITEHWMAGWEALHGAGPTFVPWVPLNQITDSTLEYVRFTIVPMTRRQATTGDTKRWRHAGELAVQIFTRANIGSRRAKELADDARVVLEGQFITRVGDDEPVVTLGGASRSPQTKGGWLMLLVTFEYSFDELRTTALVQRNMLGMRGQSNTLGLSAVTGLSDATYAAPFQAVSLIQESASAADDPIALVDYGTDPLAPWGDGTTMGPELSLGRGLAALGGTWSLCKVAVNNSSLGDGSAGSNWHPNAAYPSVGKNLFELCESYTDAALAAQGGQYAGTFWGHGERDADTIFAPSYCANLRTLYAAVTARRGQKPWIMTKLNVNSDGASNAIARLQQELFAAITPLVWLIDTDDLALFDLRHFNADSQVAIGQRAAAAYVAMSTVCTLSTTITESADPVNAGAAMSYAVVVTAIGVDAQHVGTEVILPAGASFVSGSGPGWTVLQVGTRVIARRLTISVGASPTLTINVTAQADAGSAVAQVNAVAANCLTVATDTDATTINAGSSWSVDATSGLPRPANGAEWGALLTSLSAGAGPSHAYLCQESSGALADSIGAANLAASGTVSYQNAVAGQTAKAVGFGGTAGDRFSSGVGPAPASTSTLMVMVVRLAAPPVAEATLGGLATGWYFTQFTNGVLRAFVGAGGGGNNLTSHTGLCCIAVRHNRTTGSFALFSQLEKALLANDAGGVGTLRMGLGGVDGTGFTTHAGAKVLLAAVFEGAAAEKTDAQIKAIVGSLGGVVPPWS